MDFETKLLIFGAFIIILMFLGAVLDSHDSEIMKAGDAYATCVQETYGQTPSEYLNHFGHYPECHFGNN